MRFDNQSALREYRQVGVRGHADEADPVKLISMLMSGAQEHIAAARGAIEHMDIALKGEHISKAVMIIQALHDSVREDSSPDLAQKLTALYEYMVVRLTEGNVRNAVSDLDEAAGLLSGIESAWDQVPTLLAEHKA